jgi:hypothetical protein
MWSEWYYFEKRRMLGIKGEMITKAKEEQRSLTKVTREIKGGMMVIKEIIGDKDFKEGTIGRKDVPNVEKGVMWRVNVVLARMLAIDVEAMIITSEIAQIK